MTRLGPAGRLAVEELARGNQWIGPVLLALVGTALINASDPGPLLAAAGPGVALMLCVAAWTGQAGLRRTDPALSDTAAAAAGGARRLAGARIAVRAALSHTVAAAVLGWTWAVVREADGPRQALTCALALSAASLLGTAIGTVTAPPVMIPLARGTLTASAVLLVLLIAPISPMHVLLSALLDDNGSRAAALYAWATGTTALVLSLGLARRRAQAP